MAVIRIPFCATRELSPPFILDEDYDQPNGVKSILLDGSRLQVVMKSETVSVPDIGDVELCVYYVAGTISYICNAFPIIQSSSDYDVIQLSATFDADTPSSECVTTTESDALGWLSASGCVNVYESIGGSCGGDDLPSIESVTIEDLAVANNETSGLSPTCEDSCGEEGKRIVKWRGCIVITTAED